jgi:hypothetical protein
VTTFYPDEFLGKVLGSGFFRKKLLNNDIELKRTAVRGLLRARAIAGDDLDKSIDGVVAFYQNKSDELKDLGEKAFKADAVNGEGLLKNRIENIVVQAEVKEIVSKNKGKQYEWLPSDADVPDPEHQLLYGQIFDIDEGDDEGNRPGERYGCRCGMRILDE